MFLTTLTLLAFPALQDGSTTLPPQKPIRTQESGNQKRDKKALSDGEYYRALQAVKREAERRGDTKLVGDLDQRLRRMAAPQRGARNQADRARGDADRVRRQGNKADKADRKGGNKGKDRSQEARISALEKQIAQMETMLAERKAELAALNSGQVPAGSKKRRGQDGSWDSSTGSSSSSDSSYSSSSSSDSSTSTSTSSSSDSDRSSTRDGSTAKGTGAKNAVPGAATIKVKPKPVTNGKPRRMNTPKKGPKPTKKPVSGN